MIAGIYITGVIYFVEYELYNADPTDTKTERFYYILAACLWPISFLLGLIMLIYNELKRFLSK